MFTNKDVSVGEWIILWFILAIPVLNVVFIIYALLSPNFNQSLKNLVLATIFVGAFILMFYLFFFIATIGMW